ncbi:MAG: glycosyltransferase [Planctomycetes bacterium]|nr:glycosyltransferase [Planctomycetota bacterium]
MIQTKTKTIIISGGGTGGPVIPLITLYRDLKEEYNFYFIGGNGLEKDIVAKEGIPFFTIRGGKYRRYFSWLNFLDIINIVIGFFQSLIWLRKNKADLVISAGAFISVPLVWAAWFCGVPVIIHQQDVRSGLANKLMAPFAAVITTVFERSLKDYGKKSVLIGNIIDLQINIKEEKRRNNNLPLLLIIGGATGAMQINELIWQSVGQLSNYYIIHQCGVGKKKVLDFVNYEQREFIDHQELIVLIKEALVVVSRCGLSTLTELSAFAKTSILIPMPGSHQEDNARIFQEQKAAIVLDKESATKENFIKVCQELLKNENLQKEMENNIKQVIKKNGLEGMKKIINNILK